MDKQVNEGSVYYHSPRTSNRQVKTYTNLHKSDSDDREN
jgi:hypothetical protein